MRQGARAQHCWAGRAGRKPGCLDEKRPAPDTVDGQSSTMDTPDAAATRMGSAAPGARHGFPARQDGKAGIAGAAAPGGSSGPWTPVACDSNLDFAVGSDSAVDSDSADTAAGRAPGAAQCSAAGSSPAGNSAVQSNAAARRTAEALYRAGRAGHAPRMQTDRQPG